MNIEDMYTDVVAYAQHLERLLIMQSFCDEELIKEMRKDFIKPATNVAQEWLKEDKQ